MLQIIITCKNEINHNTIYKVSVEVEQFSVGSLVGWRSIYAFKFLNDWFWFGF